MTDVKRCFQFCSIEAAYTFACRFVNLLMGSDDAKLAKFAKDCIDLNPLRENKSIRMTGCGKGVNPETGDALAVPNALKHMSRTRVLHPTALARGFTFRDTFLTLKQPDWRDDHILPYKADAELCVKGQWTGFDLKDEEETDALDSLLYRVKPRKYTISDLRLDKARRGEGESVLIPLSAPYCLIKAGTHRSCKGYFVLTARELRYGCPSKTCKVKEQGSSRVVAKLDAIE